MKSFEPFAKSGFLMKTLGPSEIKRFFFVSLFFLTFLSSSITEGAIVQINGKWSDNKFAPTYPLPEHFDLGCRKVQEKEWEEALHNFLIITTHFPESSFFADSLYYSGVCYYFMDEFDMANKQFSLYLDQKSQLNHFDKVFLFKFQIAEAYRTGARKHIFGTKSLPRMASGKKDALELYEEIITSLPHQELGAKALYGKALVLRSGRNFDEGIEALNTLVRRFPKYSQTPDAYLLISEIYLEKSQRDAQNPDFIDLAKVNLSHFYRDFPAEERVGVAEENISKMQEVLAASLLKTGRYYEKKKKPKASAIYYNEALKRYPETVSAQKCKERLSLLKIPT